MERLQRKSTRSSSPPGKAEEITGSFRKRVDALDAPVGNAEAVRAVLEDVIVAYEEERTANPNWNPECDGPKTDAIPATWRTRLDALLGEPGRSCKDCTHAEVCKVKYRIEKAWANGVTNEILSTDSVYQLPPMFQALAAACNKYRERG